MFWKKLPKTVITDSIFKSVMCCKGKTSELFEKSKKYYDIVSLLRQ